MTTNAYTVHDSTAQGRDAPIQVRDYIPRILSKPTGFLWVHGGGFTTGGLDQKESDAPARALAATGRWVRTVNYRLAPKLRLWGKLDLSAAPGRFPAAHHDIIDVAQSFRADTGNTIAMGGGSAGANLVAGATLAMRDNNTPPPRTLVLAYGAFHAHLPDNNHIERELRGPLARWAFNDTMYERITRNYIGNNTELKPGYAFPGEADLHRFPTALVIDAHNDRLRRSGTAFAKELQEAGANAHHVVIPGMHAFLNTPQSTSFTVGLRLIQQWLDTHEAPLAQPQTA